MALRTYGELFYDQEGKQWKLDNIEPHVAIKLKNIFIGIRKSQTAPFFLADSNQMCTDLLWLESRYPLRISDADRMLLIAGENRYKDIVSKSEEILLPDYKPREIRLKASKEARHYQLVANDFYELNGRYLLGDDLGLGKTISAILTFLNSDNLPAAVVAQSHLPFHWEEKIQEFTDLKVHIVKKANAYNLPPADVYIFKYTSLYGWTDLFATGFFKSSVFDEIQELRCGDSVKYDSSVTLANNVMRCLGMSATPIYNYGNEIFNVLNVIKPGCLGTEEDFLREWTTNDKVVKDPKALGTLLRDNNLMLRRTRAEVGRELPPVNRIIVDIDYDEDVAYNSEALTRALAIKVTSGNFMERGQAAREFDVQMRHTTGVAKAKHVAAYVRMLLENGEAIVLAGWHRDVYTIWLSELSDYKPVFYTGSESPKQKRKSVREFVEGETNLFIISLRSGIGVDGLQHRSNIIVVGELDWSPKVHEQLIGRVDRDRGDHTEQVTAIFPICDYGSDPEIVDMLGLKSSQSQGIVDPNSSLTSVHTDESRIKKMAEAFLQKKMA